MQTFPLKSPKILPLNFHAFRHFNDLIVVRDSHQWLTKHCSNVHEEK